MLTGVEAIRQSWAIILNTVKGSDPLRPTFGSGIFEYIDKPITLFMGDFISQVITDLERWETRTTISQVKVTLQDNKIALNISGLQKSTGNPLTATISLSNLETMDNSVIKRAYSDAYNNENYG